MPAQAGPGTMFRVNMTGAWMRGDAAMLAQGSMSYGSSEYMGRARGLRLPAAHADTVPGSHVKAPMRTHVQRLRHVQ